MGCLFDTVRSVYAVTKIKPGICGCAQLGGRAFVFSEYGRIILFTIYAIFISQPIIAHFLVLDFHTLPPNFSTIKTNNVDLLPGVDPVFTVTTDAYGFRSNTPDAYSAKYKIFMVGGSTTEQITQDNGKTTAALLERGIGSRDYSVINTGLSGLRTINHIATIDFIRKFQPSLVVVQLGVNDWDWSYRRILVTDGVRRQRFELAI
jgi:hypothetical protein